jgi:feruloyl esterase
MGVVAEAVRAQCDALDGASDGIVGAPAQCQQTFDIERLACSTELGDRCLAPQQVAALERAFAGPADKNGRPLYASWLFDTGIGSNDWRTWRLESPIPGFEGLPLIATLGAGSLAQIFTTPPTAVAGTAQGLLEYLRAFDFERDAPKIDATTPAYPISAMDFMAPADWRNPRLAELKSAGGKVIVYHGTSDGAFSVQATIDWYTKLHANNDGDVDDFTRFYPVPGMTHCGGGPATDRFDAFGALVAWVEQGTAPGDLIAEVRADNADLPASWSKTRSRPLCDWPKIARYRGTGDLESAASFVCE